MRALSALGVIRRAWTPWKAALVSALALLSAGGGSEAAEAAFPGQQGRLAFFFDRDVWVVNPDGANPIRLTTSPGLDRSPSWSPDGQRLAFASERNGLSEIFVMNADGSDQRRVTFNTARDRTNAWTADGRQIVYDKEFTELYVVNADGSGGERKLVDGLLPGTSPYGDRVAFSAGGGLFTIKLDGSERRQITEFGDFSPDWSPGGTDLVFTRAAGEDNRDVYRVHENGVGLARLTNTPARSEVGPVWSPDGRRIAFLGCSNPLGSTDCGIYLMNGDGSGEAQVPGVSASFAEGGIDWQPMPPFPQGQAPVPLTVSIAARGGTGTVASVPLGLQCPDACSTEFDRGSTIRLEARPSGNAAFLGWSGACSGRTTSCSVVMDGEKRVAASFGRSTFRLTVAVRGPGKIGSAPAGISCPRRCKATFSRGVRVVLRARAAPGAELVGWSGACKGSRGCRVSMTADRVVRARFRR